MQVVYSALKTLLFLHLVGETKTAPLTSLSEASKPSSVNKYKLGIKMVNVLLKEKIDVKRRTGVVIIAKHGSKSGLIVIKNFSKKLDIIFDNNTKTCYISRQQLSGARPDTLKAAMENKSISEDNNLVLNKTTTTWKIDKVFTQRYLLSGEMAIMCARSSIYWLQKVEETGSRQSRDTDHGTRLHRSSCLNHSNLCWYEVERGIVWRKGKPRIITRRVKKCRRIC